MNSTIDGAALLPHQKSYFDVLLGTNDTQNALPTGARRAWISLPAGHGETHAVCAAIDTLYGAQHGVLNVLYVTQKSLFHSVELLLQTPCHRIQPDGNALVGVDLCSPDMLRKYHDTAIQYTGYDLIVVDLCFDPLSGRGGPSLVAAMRTLLRTAKRLWIVGDEQ